MSNDKIEILATGQVLTGPDGSRIITHDQKPGVPKRLLVVGPGQFVCEICIGVFDKAWSDDEAAAELSEKFNGATPSESGVVCDDCYRQMGFTNVER